MHLYLVRHAHALDAEENPERPLSKRGWKQVRALAKFLRETGAFDAAEIWHSPLARSRETAEGLAERLKLAAPLQEVTGLTGEDDPRAIAERIEALEQPAAIVGHEPHLSALASLLVAGEAEPPAFVLKKCAALRLDRVEDRWAVRWLISPELLG
jgi:phosphohistidine phosphatase